MQDHAAKAQAGTHGLPWSAARVMPSLGLNVRAVQTVAEVIDGLATNALPTLMDATSLVDPTTLAPVDGRVDRKQLVKAAPKVVAAYAEVQTVGAQARRGQPRRLLAAVASPLADLRQICSRSTMAARPEHSMASNNRSSIFFQQR